MKKKVNYTALKQAGEELMDAVNKYCAAIKRFSSTESPSADRNCTLGD